MSTATTDARRLGEDHPSLHDRVKDALAQAILSGRLRPGERIVEERLAAEFGVSRNPVREAIRALAAEGLVEVSARRGASVASLSVQEARETVEVRALLEGHNARLAARRRDAETLRTIQSVLDRGTGAVARERFGELSELNRQFHRALAAAGQNRVLGEMLDRLRDRTAMLFAPEDPGRQQGFWEEHAGILQAILEGDEDEAARRATAHVINAGSQLSGRKPPDGN